MQFVKVIPVVTLHGEEEALRALSALEEGGLPVAEITLRTPYGQEAISLCAKRFPRIALGAGSVIDAEQARRAFGNGAKFIVSPGLSEEVFLACAEANIAYLPGAVTPTELMRAYSLGLRTVKFFPADVFGGLKAIRALSAVFPYLKFVPTGGVNLQNLGEYLAHPAVAAVGGSFMMKGDIAKNCGQILRILGEA